MTAPVEIVAGCRSCGAGDLVTHIDFGPTPIADRLVRPGQPEALPAAPLSFAQCPACGLAQIRETVAPGLLFGGDYPYYSSVSPALLRHFGDSARALIAARGLGADSLVMEAASNDGYMLEVFARAGIPVLGIDPAPGPAAAAQARGVETLNTFFGADLARTLAAAGRRADLFLANNVLAHVADLNGFVAGIAAVLAPGGQAVIECPYVVDLVDHAEFDTIYHQHLCYFSVETLVALFARHGLGVSDVARIRVHGGSLRVFVDRSGRQSDRLRALRAEEAARGVNTPAFHADFARRVDGLRTALAALLAPLRAQGARMAGYGAAAKAATFLHHMGIGRETLTVIADRNPNKQGWEMPGTRIPVVAPERLYADRPDHVLILAWNFANEIAAEHAALAAAGTRFIVPIPRPQILAGARVEIAL